MSTQYLAYDYPVLGAFWTLLWIALFAIWIVLLFRIAVDIFRDRQLSGWAKAGWLLFVLVLPYLGVFAYLVARGSGMADREVQETRDQRRLVDAYIRETAGAGNSDIATLTRLSELRASGDLTESEFRLAKEKILH